VPGFVIDDFMLLEMNCRMFIRKLAYLDGIIVDKIKLFLRATIMLDIFCLAIGF